MVFRTAYRLTGNASDAEDVLQTVFLRLLRRDPSAGPVDNPESYLRRAAIHASLDLIRERQKRAEAPLEPAAARAPDDVGLRDLLRQALAALDPRQAEMFTLRFLEGYSNGEIARMLGMSQVLVAVTVHRTRRRLQKEMQGHIRGGRS
jgi:RNA polymerase sigma-70 factor (ECF subfamily)